MMNRFLIIVLFFICALPILAQETKTPQTKTPEKANTRPDEKPQKAEPYDKASVQEMAKCVTFETAEGSIIAEMFPETAPITVRNFLNLVAIKAFDNTSFTRVVPGFVIQGGNLWSNPDITYEMKWRAARTIQDEPNLVRHERGILSMARGDEANTATTSFFILVSNASSLDNKFAAFGKVVTGMDVVDAINKLPVENEKPKDPIVIKKATIGECVLN